MLRIPFLQPGTFVSRNGARHSFGEKQFKEILDYSPARWRAPVLIGHDLPEGEGEQSVLNRRDLAFGVIDRIVRAGKYLAAEVSKYDPRLKQWHEQGALANVSMKLFHPDDPSNPTPGRLSFRHLAFVPEPGVSGLPEPSFGEFSSDCDPAFALEFALGDPMTPTPEELALEQREAAIAQREADFARQQLEFAAQRESATLIAPLVAAGKISPAQEPALIALRARLAVLPEDSPLEFAAPAGTKPVTPLAALDLLLNSLPKQIEFAADVSGDDEGPEPGRTAQQMSAAALEYQAAQAKLGIEVSLVDAYNHANGGKK